MSWLDRWLRVVRWLRRLLFRRGYWICADDWQGDLDECRYVDEMPPVKGETVYYRSGGELKPWGKR